MKRLLIGIALLTSSTLLYCSNIVAAAVYSETKHNTSWTTDLGVYKSALREVSIIPMFVIFILMLAGLVIISIEVYKEFEKNQHSKL
ncbi:hypothetical protein ACFOU0_00690 [Salinicoccus sesuvii]|uniref:Phosphatase n=1 Tax=Salinicoccus sesuvii TaxID=868281 RepID=A0ABV7N2Q9_9STAP